MTKIISAEQIDENSFYVDFLYYPSTSYSKSLYPTISRAFNRYAPELMTGGGHYNQKVEMLEVGNRRAGDTTSPYFIKRVTWSK